MSRKSALLLQVTHLLGTEMTTKYGFRQAHNCVATVDLDGEQSKIYLGAMLRKGTSTLFNHEEIIRTHNIGAVVRILQNYELSTVLIDGSQAPTPEEIKKLGCATFDVAIPDFSYEWNCKFEEPVRELFNHFRELVAIQQQNKSIFFHCKAGVNRSFKAVVMYIVYLNFVSRQEKNAPIDELQLRQQIVDICMHVKARRPAADFGANHKNQQINFILTAFKKIYPRTIIQFDDHQTRLSVILKLEKYIDSRLKSRLGMNIFRNSAISYRKIEAARVCILSIVNEDDVESSLKELETTVNCIKEGGDLLTKVIPAIRKGLSTSAAPTYPQHSGIELVNI